MALLTIIGDRTLLLPRIMNRILKPKPGKVESAEGVLRTSRRLLYVSPLAEAALGTQSLFFIEYTCAALSHVQQAMLSQFTPRSMRRINPLSTRPGPIS